MIELDLDRSAVVFIPDADYQFLLSGGPCGARPPLAVERRHAGPVDCYFDCDEYDGCALCGMSWEDGPARCSGHRDFRWYARDDRAAQLSQAQIQWSDENPAAGRTALVIRWCGAPAWDGVDRLVRASRDWPLTAPQIAHDLATGALTPTGPFAAGRCFPGAVILVHVEQLP